jgi:hypothetical protein
VKDALMRTSRQTDNNNSNSNKIIMLNLLIQIKVKIKIKIYSFTRNMDNKIKIIIIIIIIIHYKIIIIIIIITINIIYYLSARSERTCCVVCSRYVSSTLPVSYNTSSPCCIVRVFSLLLWVPVGMLLLYVSSHFMVNKVCSLWYL